VGACFRGIISLAPRHAQGACPLTDWPRGKKPRPRGGPAEREAVRGGGVGWIYRRVDKQRRSFLGWISASGRAVQGAAGFVDGVRRRVEPSSFVVVWSPAHSSSCWSPVRSSPSECWRRSRRFRRRVRVREGNTCRQDTRCRRNPREVPFSFISFSLGFLGCVCVCEASSDRVELE